MSGSTLGGGAFCGLCRLLTGARTFDDMLALSREGDSDKVDLLVRDIYGECGYTELGLPADLLANSFGRVFAEERDLQDFDKAGAVALGCGAVVQCRRNQCMPGWMSARVRADLALALCRMVCFNAAHLAVLSAQRCGVSRIVFAGFFVRERPHTMDMVSHAVNFWSGGELAALYLRHDGFLGALGALLAGCAPNEQGSGKGWGSMSQ